jgi:hypothetical protein
MTKLPRYLILAASECADDGSRQDKLFYTDRREFHDQQRALREALTPFAAFTLTHVASNGAL